MVRAVVKVSGKVNYGIAGKYALLHTFAKSLLYCREEVLRNCAAEYRLGECKTFVFSGRERDLNVAVLT